MNEKSENSPFLEGVMALATLVTHQPGAVVSRTLAKKPAGTITAFAFDEGEGLSEHTAPFDAWIMGIEGEATIQISYNPFHLGGGQILKLPAGQPHAIQAITPFKMLLIMIRA